MNTPPTVPTVVDQNLGWGLLSQFHPFRYFPNFFQHCQNTCWLLNSMFIFDRCRRSSAAVAPVKYKCDSNNLRGTFTRSKILLTEKLTNGALVTPTPELQHSDGPNQQKHGWPSTQPGSLHTALQRKYTQACSLFSRGTAVCTMGARLCEQWGTAVCKCPAV